MKKLIIVLLTAALAAAGCGSAACSKGQTGGGNNALSGYVRQTEDGGCNCGENCDCGDGCRTGDCDCGDDCPCRRDGGSGHMNGMPPVPDDENASGRMNEFEFDHGRLGRRGRRGLPDFMVPNGNVWGRPMPDDDGTTPDGVEDENGNAESTLTGDAEKQKSENTENDGQGAAPRKVRRNGRRRYSDGRRNASGKLPKLPAENSGN